MTTRVSLIGFGEVGQTLAADLTRAGVEHLVAWVEKGTAKNRANDDCRPPWAAPRASYQAAVSLNENTASAVP